MKKILLITMMFLWATSLFSQYTIGATVPTEDNLPWTTTTGYSSSIFEQTSNGKAVMIFWGEDW